MSCSGNGSDGNSPRSTSRGRSAWRLPGALFDGVRHRFKEKRDKFRAKSPEWDWRRQNGTLPSGPHSDTELDAGCTRPKTFTTFTADKPVFSNGSTPVHHHSSLPRPHSQTNGYLVPPLIRSNSTGTSASVTSSEYGFQDWRRSKPRSAVLQAMRPRKQGKSVRFGENRISVFLQDPTQALEEVVKLALGYAEQDAISDGENFGNGGTVSDTEAVNTLTSATRRGATKYPTFWSDSERDPLRSNGPTDDDDEDDDDYGTTKFGGPDFRELSKRVTSSLSERNFDNPALREDFYGGTNSSSSILKRRPFQSLSNNGPVYQAQSRINGSDRLKYRKRRSAQINEIFAFIDKVLSSCDPETVDRLGGEMRSYHGEGQPTNNGLDPRLRPKEVVGGITGDDSPLPPPPPTATSTTSNTATASHVPTTPLPQDLKNNPLHLLSDGRISSTDKQRLIAALDRAFQKRGKGRANHLKDSHPGDPPSEPPYPAWQYKVEQGSWTTSTTTSTTSGHHTAASSASTSSCSYRPSSSSQGSQAPYPPQSGIETPLLPQPSTSTDKKPLGFTPDEALKALQTLTRLTTSSNKYRRRSPPAYLSRGFSSESDSDSDEESEDAASVISVASRRSARVASSSGDPTRSLVSHQRSKSRCSPTTTMLMSYLEDDKGSSSLAMAASSSTYSASIAGGESTRMSIVRRTRTHRQRSSKPKPTADMFATILLCSDSTNNLDKLSESSRGRPVNKGMTMYKHIHSKITQDVCNAIFLCKISDDDRMSLTTAQSDEDEIESSHNSPYKAKQSGSAASFNCTGAVRKAGFLSVKKWILRKKHQVELARKRGWKGYWVCLKGTTLLFYPCDSREGRSVEATPKHLIIVDGAIMQAIPEHPKRDYIFCLSTAFGDAYLFQAPCQVELENWVNSIHSACAAAFARHRGKTGTLHLLQEEIYRLEKNIESDQKLKHMAELQLSVVSDSNTKIQIENQITQWEENLERLHCEQFRLRCYMASLQNGELPNPKGVLTQVTSSTKQTLNRLGVFTVSSFHAYICARSPSLLNNLLAGRGATKRRAPLLSRSNSAGSRRSLTSAVTGPNGTGSAHVNGVATVLSPGDGHDSKLVKVTLPDSQIVTFYLRDAMTVEDFLGAACIKKGLQPVEHFVRVKKRRDMPAMKYFVPHRSDLIETYLQTHEVVEVCAKILYQVELNRGNLDTMWGFSVEAELVENSDKQDELCCYVSRVEERSVAMTNGIIKGDEIMVINGAIVSDLDMMFIESVLQEEIALCMMMRSSRTEPPDPSNPLKSTDDMIDSLVCPPPPSDNPLNEEAISSLIVPAPEWSKDQAISPEGDSTAPPSQASERSEAPPTMVATTSARRITPIQPQVKGVSKEPRGRGGGTGAIIGDQPPLDVDALLNKGGLGAKDSPTSEQPMTPTRTLSDTEKLRKVICELVDTEHTYVRHLGFLMNTYLEPLKDEGFLSSSEISSLFGNIQEIYTFQQQFLRTLEEAIESEPQFQQLDSPPQFKNVLFSIANAFLYYVNHFKLYSSFCASHSKAQKALHPNEGNQALQEFLHSLNPRQQHSTALESYLIKPIQRILKYPLLLQQLKSLSPSNSDEQQHLIEALIGMEKVAEHINEMQRIHEEYGAIFDHLFRQHQKASKQAIDLSPGDLLYYGGVEWLNIADFLGKIKKGLELHAMCFVFKTAVVFLCKERLRQKKKSLIGTSSKSNQAEVEIIRYQVLIPVNEVQVRASSVKDVESHYLWELIHLKNSLQRRNEKVYHLSNSTAEFRNAFLKTIRQIIRESVRNMSLPLGMSMTPSSNSPLSGATSHLIMTKPDPPMRSQSTRLSSNPGGSQTQPPESPQHGGTHTLQLNRKRAPPKQPFNSLQRHSNPGPMVGGRIPDYDNVENCRFDSGANDESSVGGEESDGQQPLQAQHQTSAQANARRTHQPGQHHRRQPSSGQTRSRNHGMGEDDIEYMSGSIIGPGGSVSETESLTRGGDKSEGEEGSERTSRRRSHQLGQTPSHLTLSNTSTLSTLSTASSQPPPHQQRVQILPPDQGSTEDRRSSNNGHANTRSRPFDSSPAPPPPPPHASGLDLGSPVWKPRHNGRGRHPDQPLVSSSGSSREYQPASRRPHSEYGSTSSHDESLQSASKQA